MSFFYQRNISGLKRFDNSNNVVELYSYGSGNTITGFTPTISGTLTAGSYSIDLDIVGDGVNAGIPNVNINDLTGELLFDASNKANANTSPSPSEGGISDPIPNYYGIRIIFTPDDVNIASVNSLVYFKVLPKTLTVGYNTLGNGHKSKVYDGNDTANILTGDIIITGLFSPVTLSNVIFTSANYDSTTVSDTRYIYLQNFDFNIKGTGARKSNYVLPLQEDSEGNPTPILNLVGSITPKTITPNFTVSSKIYNANTSVSNSQITVVSISGLVSPDGITEALLSYNASYNTANAGTNNVNFTNISSGNSNYAVNSSTQTITGVAIDKRILTLSLTPSNKTYDNITTASGTIILNNVQGSDSVSYTYSTITFDNKNVGTGKTVTIYNVQITDTNYDIVSSFSSTANITAKTLVPTYTVSSKEYNKSNNATLNIIPPTGIFAGNDATINVISATFDSIYPNASIPVTATVSLTGNDASNYSIDTSPDGLTGEITIKSITSSWSVISRAYNRNTTATVSGTLNNVETGDVVNVSYTSANYDTIHVGTGKTVSISGIVLSGTDSAYYSTNASASVTGDITAKAVTGNFTVVAKGYDATRTATVNYTLSGVVSGDSLTLSSGISATYDTASRGSGKTVTINNILLVGTNNTNYSISSSTTVLGDITVKELTPNVTITAKSYDRTLTATVGSTTLTGLVLGDAVELLYTSANYRTFTVGIGKDVDISGLSLSGDVNVVGNYSLSQNYVSTTGDINQAPVTVSYPGPSKEFDGTNNITVSGTINTIYSGDTVTVTQDASFIGSSVATGKQVNITNITLGGIHSDNYILSSSSASISGIISKRTITGTYTGVNKVFDGSNNATYTYSLNNLVTGYTNVIIAAGSVPIFTDVNVGTRNISITNITLTSTDAGNYAISSSGSTSADITQKRLGISFTVPPINYNGSTTATFSGVITGIVGSENITFSNISATYNNKDIGVDKPVTVTGITIAGDITNYTIDGTLTTSGTINQRPLTPLYTVQDKTYDQSNNAVVATRNVSNLVDGESVTLTESGATFVNLNAGSRSATITGIAISGPQSSNYSIVTSVSTTTNATINPVTLTATFTTTTKIYNASTTAVVTPSLTGILTGENSLVSVNMLNVIANFDTKDVGTNKTVNISNIALTGSGNSNYSVSSTASSTGNITVKELGISFTTITKDYDGNTNATVSGILSNIVNSEPVSFIYSPATFDTKDYGTGKTVTITGITLDGSASVILNYTVSGSVTSTGTINKKVLTSSWVAISKTYDTTTNIDVSGTLSGVVGSENVTVSGTGAIVLATYGTHTVNVTSIALNGSDISNYSLSSVTSSTTGTINKRTIYGYAVDKIYNGTRNATVTLSGVLTQLSISDDVYVSNGLFDTLDASNNKVVTGDISGNDALNYYLDSIQNANITKKEVTGVLVSRNYNNSTIVDVDLTNAALETVNSIRDNVTATANLDLRTVGTRTATSTTLGGTKSYNYTLVLSASTVSITSKPIIAVTTPKTYDGTRTTTLDLSGIEIVGSVTDIVNISGSFNSKNIGSNVSISAYIYGEDSGNYVLNTDISANINIRDISGTAQSRAYDGTTNVIISLNNNINTDNLSISGTIADKNIGLSKIVTPVLTGIDASNYNFVSVSNVDITVRTLTATADNKTYNRSNNATFTFSNNVSGDDINLSGTFNSIDVSSSPIIVTLIRTVYGLDASNYNFTSTSFSALINKKNITGSCVTRAYNGSTSINVNSLSGVISGDTVTCAGTLDNRRPGTRGVSGVLGGAQAGNYNLTSVTDVVISQKLISCVGQSKTYDRTTTAIVDLSPVVESIDTSNVTITANYISFDVSSNSSVSGTLGGSEAGNYSLTSISVGSITRKDITATGLDKVYNRNTIADISLNGVIAGDENNVSYTANFADKLVALNKTISGSISGSRAFNYNLTSISNASITLLGITGAAASRDYNGSDIAIVTLTGVIGGDDVSANGVFNNRLADSGKSVTATLIGNDSGNYNITNSGTISANINTKSITGTSQSRYYDGTTNVTVSLNNVESIDTSNVTLSGSMTNKLIGIGKTVSGSLAGSARTNYLLTSISTVTISAKIITGTGINKIYDSLTYADISLNDVVVGDTVVATGNFSTRDVSSNKPITANALTGTDAGNYTLSSVSNANITTKLITATSIDRIYDRTTNVTVTPNNIETFDNGNVTLSGSMTNKSVGNNKTVSGFLTGSRAFNYRLNSISTVNISKKDCSGNTQNKTYDGTTTATITTPLIGVISGDIVDCSANFDTRHIGTGKTVSGTLTSTDAGNYNLTSLTSANITQKTISGTTSDKIYDRTTTATITLNGVETIDDGNVTVTGTFSSKDVSNNTKLVTATISGSMSSNYTLGSVSRAMINAKRLTGITFNKDYNASSTAEVRLVGVITDDSVLISANFNNKNAGDSKPVTGVIYGTDYENYYIDASSISVANIQQKPSVVVLGNKTYDGTLTASGIVQDLEQVNGVDDQVIFNGSYITRDASDSVTGTGTLSGNDAANYQITSFVAGRIYKKSINGTSQNKTYDGLNTATIDLSGVITVDSVRDSVSAVGTFASVRVANNIVVSGSLTGTHSGNYTLNSVSIANITPLTITATTATPKTYDGTDSATVSINAGQLKTVSGSLDSVSITGAFDNKNVGTNKLITAAISGTESYNYTLGTVSRADIIQKPITGAGISRPYNGLTGVDLSLNNIISGDVVTGTGTFVSKYVGTGITISSGILAGIDGNNYNLTTITAANITQRTVTGTGHDKVYDSLLTADVSLNNVVSGDNLTISANFISKDVSSNSSITGTLHGTDVSNYTLSTISSAAISEKPITGYADNKTYNKTTTAIIHLNSIESGDTVTVTGTFSSDQIGNRSISSITLAGRDGFNYSINTSDVSGATILARGIYGYGVNKVYNGTTTASVTLSDTISGDVISAITNFNNRFVGSSKSISGSLTGTDSGNYNLLGIYPANITVKSVTASTDSKTYDRTNSATFVLSGIENIDTSNVTISGNYLRITVGTDISATATISGSMAYNYNLTTINNGSISGKHITGTTTDKPYNASNIATVTLSDVISPDIVTVSAYFNSIDVSSNKTVSGSISGADSGNYILDSISNASITAKQISALSNDRVYDGTTNVTITYLNNIEVVDQSDVSLSGSMTNKLVGNNKTVSGALSGSRAFNYLLTSISNVNISRKSITGISSNKVYDSTRTADISLNNVVLGDIVNVTGLFDTKNIDSSKVVTGLLSGTDASNYTLSSVSTANITAKPITGTSVDRVYDGTTNVTITYLSNIEVSDRSNVTLSGSMTNKLVGNNKTVSGVLQGSEATNYSLTSISNVNISAKTITGIASNKVYDSTRTADISLNNVVSGDTVNVSGLFDTKNIGSSKVVTGSLSGTDASNYTLSSVSNADITIRTVTGKGRDRAYNATTDVIVDLSNNISGDNVSATGVISSKNVGSNDVLITTLLGSDASNYNVGVINNAVISAKNISASAQNKVYSSSRQTDISLNSVEQGDLVTGVASFISRYVANSVPIDVSSVVLSGLDRNNYNVTVVTSANITPLTLTATGQNKVYDGTTNATISYNNLVSPDVVTYNASFDTRHVGVSKTISGVLTGGADVYNYVLGAISNADIIKLDISGTGYPKIYNGSTIASVDLNGVLNIDRSDVSVTANFNTRHVGTNKTISGSIFGASSGNYNLTAISNSDISALNITGYSQNKVYNRLTNASVELPDIIDIDNSGVYITANANFSSIDVSSNVPVSGSLVGTYASNYTVTFTTANITRKPLTARAADKVYNNSTYTTFQLYGIISPDVVDASGSYNTPYVDTNKASTATLYGSSANNYSLSNSDISGGSVTVKSITGTGISKVYDRTVFADVSLNDVESNDRSSVGYDASFNNRLVGNSKSITGVLTGANAYNYLLTGISSADITKKSLSCITSDKPYDGLNTASVEVVGTVPGDVVNVSAVFYNIFAEDNKVVTAIISGTDSSNYILPSNSISRATINRKGIFGTGLSKDYDGLRNAIVDISNELVSVNGTLDSVNVTALFATKNVGDNISISGSINGPHAYNYTLSGIYSANIRRKQITAVGNNKIYDNTIDATTTLSGVILADEINVIAPIGMFADKYVDTNITITLTNSISGSERNNYELINNTTSADITPKALIVDWHVHNKTYDSTNTAVVYYTSISGVFNTDGVVFIDNFSASFDTAEAGFVKTVSIVDIVLSGPKSYNYYVPDSNITGSILGKGSNLFINNGLTINQNTGLYSEEHNVESDLNFDYVILFNVSALTGVSNNITNIFSNSFYIQNSQNADDVNIHLSIPNHLSMSNMSFNWDEINQQNLITVSRGRATVGFGTFFAEPVRFGETLLEIMAHKIFGHAQARSAISNDAAFNEHDEQLWDHLSSSIANRNFQLSVFNQYITSGRYNIENQNLESSDSFLNQSFNFQGMTFDFPVFLNGALLVDGQSINDTMVFRNGVNVGGAQIVNGIYNIPILLRFHD